MRVINKTKNIIIYFQTLIKNKPKILEFSLMVVFQIARGGIRDESMQTQRLREGMYKILSSGKNWRGLYLFENTRDEISAFSRVSLYRMWNLHQKMPLQSLKYCEFT